ERIADFDPDLALFLREQDEDAVVFSLLADPFPVILEQLVGVLTDVAERLDRGDGGDDDDVACGGFELPDDAVDRGRAVGVDHVSEVVDGLRELGNRFHESNRRDRKARRETLCCQRKDENSEEENPECEAAAGEAIRTARVHRALQPSTNLTRRSTASRYAGNIRSASSEEISVTCASLTIPLTDPPGTASVRSMCRPTASPS